MCQTLQSLHALQTLQTLQIVKMKPFFLFNRVALSKNKTLILAEFVLEEGYVKPVKLSKPFKLSKLAKLLTLLHLFQVGSGEAL